MITLNGKYAEAKVFTDIFDDKTVSQIIGILNSPVSEGQKVRIMPDCHSGAGCVVGTTMTIGDKVNVNFVGVDIGCGMYIVKIPDNSNLDFAKLDEACHYVPSGMASWDDEFYKVKLWEAFSINDPIKWLKQLKCFDELHDVNRLIKSLGTLGGGNHFIELDVDEHSPLRNHYLVIHTGSRNLGLQVAKIYQNKAVKNLHSNRKERDELVACLKAEGRQTEIENTLKSLKSMPATTKISDDMAWLEGEDLKDYLHDMLVCQNFAILNRRAIAKVVLEKWLDIKIRIVNITKLKGNGPYELMDLETVHNYIDMNKMILRKGAVSAKNKELLIIPMNMRDGSLICSGLGNDDWNQSAPHGAGRLMSRSSAKASLDLDEFKEEMKDIYSTTVNQSTIDESPMAYKPMQSILDNIKDTVEVLAVIKPVYNFKASE